MVYLVYSLSKEIIGKYIENIRNKENIEDYSVIKYSLDEDNIDDIIEECNTTGLFSLKKLVIIEATNAFSSKGKEITELDNYLENYNKDIIMIFTCNLEKVDTRKKIYKKISSIGKVECLTKDNNYLVSLIKERATGFKFSSEDINYLINKIGTNIYCLENEVEKLINYKYEEKEITRKDIDSLCESTIEEEVFALTDAIMKNDNNKAISLYNLFIIKNYDATQIIALIASQFRFLLQVKILYNKNKTQDDIAKELGCHPYRVKLAITNCYYYSRETLENYLLKLCDLDKKIKLGLIDKNIFLQLFIVNKDI